MPHPENYKKYNFLFFICFYRGTMGKSRLSWFNPFENQSTQSAILGQNDQNAPSQPRVEWRSKLFKTTPNNIFHVFTSHLRLSKIFVNFDEVWLEINSQRWPKTQFWFDPQNELKPTPLWRILNSISNDCSWVKCGVKTVEISWKSYYACQLTSRAVD